MRTEQGNKYHGWHEMARCAGAYDTIICYVGGFLAARVSSKKIVHARRAKPSRRAPSGLHLQHVRRHRIHGLPGIRELEVSARPP
jgi:hypothetical protein